VVFVVYNVRDFFSPPNACAMLQSELAPHSAGAINRKVLMKLLIGIFTVCVLLVFMGALILLAEMKEGNE
jgi:hypothetical protein